MDIFTGLKQLFSSNVIIRNIGGKKLKIADTDGYQMTPEAHLHDKFAKMFSSTYMGHMNDTNVLSHNSNRLEIFKDYDAMDRDPIIAAAIDIIADECCTANPYNEILSITSQNDNIKEILYNLYYDILNIESNLWSWIRNLVKYGDFFLLLQISEEYGVYNIMPMTPYSMTRVEGSDDSNVNYVYFEIEHSKKNKFENYEVAHFRLLNDCGILPYGRSHIEPARRVWKQLTLLEDAMLIHRVMRAPEKRIYKIDVGNIPANEIDSHMNTVISRIKQIPFVDNRTGEYNLKFNLQNMVQDFFFPVRGGDSGTAIESLPGMTWSGIEDLNYLKHKLFSALRVPKAFLNFDENAGSKSRLSMEDLRFSRTIERIQQIVLSELKKIGIIHLYAQGYKDEELLDFNIQLTNPSTIHEQEKVALWAEKTTLAKDLMDSKLMSRDWIYKYLFNMTGEEVENEREKILDDLKEEYRSEQIKTEGVDPAMSENEKQIDSIGAGKSSGGDDLGGDDLGGGDLGGGDLGGGDLGGGDLGGGGGDLGGGDLGGGGGSNSSATGDVSGGSTDTAPITETKKFSEMTDKEKNAFFKAQGKLGGLAGGRPKKNKHRLGTDGHHAGRDYNGRLEMRRRARQDGTTILNTKKSRRKYEPISLMEEQLFALDDYLSMIAK